MARFLIRNVKVFHTAKILAPLIRHFNFSSGLEHNYQAYYGGKAK